VEVRIPRDEGATEDMPPDGPYVPAAVLPWEYLLNAATSTLRSGRPLTVLRVLEPARALRATRRELLARCAMLIAAPEPVSDAFDFDAERRLVEVGLGHVDSIEPATLHELTAFCARKQPTLIHVGGVDTFQGRDLRVTAPARDGMILAGRNSQAQAATSQELSAATCAGRQPPELAVFNIFRSGVRTAALTVSRGAAVAIGFYDTFNDAAAELFFARLYRDLGRHAPLAHALNKALTTLRESRAHLEGTGIVVWSSYSLLDLWDRKFEEPEVLSKPKQRTPKTVEGWRKILHIGPTSIMPVARLNYSRLHNNEHLFERFKLVNLGEQPVVAAIRVCLNTGDAPLEFSSVHTIGRSETDLPGEIMIPLTSETVRGLGESVRTTMLVDVSVDGLTLFRRSFPITMLPINEWVDDEVSRQWLPSFVYPADPAVREIIAKAVVHLRAIRDDPSAGFDGYQSIDPDSDDPTAGVDAQVAAIWSALTHDFQLGYINPPPTYTVKSQRLRTPSDVISGRFGTCIDLALILCACLEYVNIYPVMFLLSGHAFPGYWRSEEDREAFL
jgi:hypothetical protein